MNRELMVCNLSEAVEQLLETIEELGNESSESPTEGELLAELAHAYHHINFAWNARHEAVDFLGAMSDEQFYRYRAFPSEIAEFLRPVEGGEEDDKTDIDDVVRQELEKPVGRTKTRTVDLPGPEIPGGLE